ncbi:hypothetical protein FISHEDRAFT_67937 [Fistulina hepatica ATCC 64428]|nr:hypothetical protein FISHEDRAFT_67937 [Fistulina hepatica ATCC 64428]
MSLKSSSRRFHLTSRRFDLIGPPDPISNLRPIIYEDDASAPQPAHTPHPYSLHEFHEPPETPFTAADLQWRLARRELDDFCQDFWFDSNLRFEAGKLAVLASLPGGTSTLDRENALSEFYKQWVMQESPRTDWFTEEWRRQSLRVLRLETHVKWHKFRQRWFGWL